MLKRAKVLTKKLLLESENRSCYLFIYKLRDAGIKIVVSVLTGQAQGQCWIVRWLEAIKIDKEI